MAISSKSDGTWFFYYGLVATVEGQRQRNRWVVSSKYLVMVFFRDFSSAMGVAFPQLDVSDLLDLENVVANKDASGVTLHKIKTKYFVKRTITQARQGNQES